MTENERNRFCRRILFSVFFPAGLLFQVQTAMAAPDCQPVRFLDDPDALVPAVGEYHYLVEFQNNSSDEAIDPRLEVTIPAGFTFVAADDPQCSYAGSTPSGGGANDTVVCTWPSLPGNTSFDVDVTMTAASATGTYFGTATAICPDDSNPANDSENNQVDVVESADLTLAKESGDSPAPAGSIVTYDFQVSNAGPFAADDLTLSDELPAGLSFVADGADPPADQDGDWNCSASGQVVSCNGPALAVGAVSTFHFRARVTRDTVGFITNPAEVTAASVPDPHPDDNTDTHTLEVTEGTDMSIAKRVDTDPVIANGPVQFTLSVTNEGPMTAADVQVTDTLPAGYGGITATSPAGWSCSVAGQVVTCDIASMASGQSEDIVIEATVPTVANTVNHQNQANVSTSTTDPVPGNDSDTVTYPVSPDIADLSITKSKSPDPVAQGSDMSSAIRVTNHGPRDASPVQVVDALAPGESYVSFSGTAWNCSAAGSSVTCDYTANGGVLANGQSTPYLTIVTRADSDGSLQNTACTGGEGGSLEPDAGDTERGNNCSNDSVTSTGDHADLVVQKSADDVDISDGENSFTYTITVHNNGPDASGAVHFTDTIPQYVSGGSGGRPATTIAASADNGGTCSVSNAQVSCDWGNLAVNDTATVTIDVSRPMREGTRTNTACAYSTQVGDPNRDDNCDEQDVAVDPVTDIEVTDKLVTYSGQPDPVLAGTEATYVIQVRNNGPSVAENVVLDDVFAGAPFTFLQASVAGGGSCSYDAAATTLACSLGDMNANTVKSVTVLIRPDEQNPPPAPWQIDNTATVDMDTADSDPANNAKSASLPVQGGVSDVTIEKNESPDYQEPVMFVPGGASNLLVYEVVVTNRGPSLATGVYFEDKVDAVNPAQNPVQELTLLYDTSRSDAVDDGIDICDNIGTTFTVGAGAPVITCRLSLDPANTEGAKTGTLDNGESYTRYLVFEVLNAPDEFSGDVYHNQSEVFRAETDGNAANNREDENTTVRTLVDLSLVKTGPAAPVEMFTSFDFTIEVANAGPGGAAATQVSDDLPAGMELTGAPVPDVGTCTGNAGDTAFHCDLGHLANGNSVSITVPVQVTSYPAGGTVTNHALVTTDSPDNDNSNNSDTAPVPVAPPLYIGSTLFYDLNDNGRQDAEDRGIAGVRVELYRAGQTPGVDAPLDSDVSDGNGDYLLTAPRSGGYFVHIPTPPETAPRSSTPTDSGDNQEDGDDNGIQPAPGDPVNSPVITLTQGGEPLDADETFQGGAQENGLPGGDANGDMTVDFGFVPLSLGSTVFFDANDNGQQDAGENGIGGVRLELYRAGQTPGVDVPLQNTVTDAAGNYLFNGLEPGDYVVYIPVPPAAAPMASSVVDPADNQEDGDSNGIQGALGGAVTSPVINLAYLAEPVNGGGANDEKDTGPDTTGAGQDDPFDPNGDMTVDFGFIPGSQPVTSLGSTVFLDRDDNGLQDLGEPGIRGVELQLFHAGDDPLVDAPVATVVTDANGDYLFAGLAAGGYFVYIPDPPRNAPLSSTTTVAVDNQVDGDDNGIQVDKGDPVRSPVITLAVGGEPVGAQESAQGGDQDDANDANGDMTVDFGFVPNPQSIPALSEWGRILLMLLILGAAFGFAGQRRSG